MEDVKTTLEGLAPGVYLSRDLYARYVRAMEAQGRAPVAPQNLGRMLTQYGALRCKRKVDGQHMRAWRIS